MFNVAYIHYMHAIYAEQNSVCVSICTKTEKLLIRDWHNLVQLCIMVTLKVIRFWSHLILTFDLKS